MYTNFQNMYTILYIQITQNFNECTQFSTFKVHYFSGKKNVHNYVDSMGTIFFFFF